MPPLTFTTDGMFQLRDHVFCDDGLLVTARNLAVCVRVVAIVGVMRQAQQLFII